MCETANCDGCRSTEAKDSLRGIDGQMVCGNCALTVARETGVLA